MLAADVFALHVDCPSGTSVSVELAIDGAPADVELHAFSHDPDGESSGQLIVGSIGQGRAQGETVLSIVVDGREIVLGPATLPRLSRDVRGLVRERLASQPVAVRVALLEFLVRVAGGEAATVDPLGLSTSLAVIREGLREPLPRCVVERDEPHGLHFDGIVALSDKAFYVRGWALDAQAPLGRLTVVSPEGARADLLPGVYRNPRPDVESFYERPYDASGEEIGFIGFCEMEAPSHASDGWILEMENSLGVGHEVPGPVVTRDLKLARAGILSDLHKERHWDTPLMDHVVPAIARIQEAIDERTKIQDVVQFGSPPRDPETSVVVPLYGRIDFLEHQLAQFVHDPEIAETDLIYVLDSPELSTGLLDAAGQLFDLYGVPFRVAILSENGGFSVANNRGASLARGRLLLLLNSDVLPDRPGWLSQMTAFYDAQDGIGALGPKLLFDDDSLQHAGICFERPPSSTAWENKHFFKGLHRSLPAANVVREVPAVTGACLMVERTLYEELGGLRGTYVQGDYEDTDLCLRLREMGRTSWYLPTVELYHLEGQSYASETRRMMSRYNIWLHTRLWGSEIERLTRAYADSADAAGVR